MGQNESVHFFASSTTRATFVSPLSSNMLLSSRPLAPLQLQTVDASVPMEVASSSIVDSSILSTVKGAENDNPNSATRLKPLEVKLSEGKVVLISTIPNGFAIMDDEKGYGKKIVATEACRKGQIMYTGYSSILDLSSMGHSFDLKVYSEDRQLLSEHKNNNTHSVDDYAPGSKTENESKRQVYGWDSFMNHSCDANAYFPLLYRTPTEMCYHAVALRDISVGEEVTCDYALFDYHCNGHEIELCNCGSMNCRGRMLGFQGLPLQTKVELLGMADREIRDKFVQDENVVVFQSYLPQGIGLVANDDGTHLVATRRFEIGQPLFINSAEFVQLDDVASKNFLLYINGEYILLNKDHHFIYRDGYAEMLGFDSFMDHSCAPSTEQEYISRNEYIVRAKKVILPGDKITCDYNALENIAANMKNLGTSSFVCTCGEKNCRGTLVC